MSLGQSPRTLEHRVRSRDQAMLASERLETFLTNQAATNDRDIHRLSQSKPRSLGTIRRSVYTSLPWSAVRR